MKPFAFFYRFTKGQQKGVAALFLMIIFCQATYFMLMSAEGNTEGEQSAEEKKWLALQGQIDELKAKKRSHKDTVYAFNPNFISDYKGYTLGMSTVEIDRLHAFRKSGKFVNSAADFKQVTKVSDSLLAKLSPYFKFPDWVNKKNSKDSNHSRYPAGSYTDDTHRREKADDKARPAAIAMMDINDAVEEDLDKVYGIGPAFAKKILRRRAVLGAYVSMDQMNEFPEFSPEAIAALKKAFTVKKQPEVTTININTASLNQLSYFPYFNKSLAKAIITRRSMKGKISKIEELLDINEFPVDKVKIIALYLEF